MDADDLRHRVDVSTLGDRLDQALKVRGRSARWLDEQMGRDRYTSKVVRGDRTKISAKTAEEIAKHLTLDSQWLVTGEGIAPTINDDLSQAGVAPKPAPYWRLDPAWKEEHALALTHRPDALPVQYLDELGDHVVPGRRPTWPLLLKMAEVLWYADLADAARHGGPPPSGVVGPAARAVAPSDAPAAPVQGTRRR